MEKHLPPKVSQWLKIFLVIFFVLLQLLIITYNGNNKTYYDIDETSSYTLANNPGGMIWYNDYGWIHAGTFQRFGVTERRFSLPMVWENQFYDCHPPLYYTSMHLISSAFPGRLTPWIGVFPNVVCHFITLGVIGYILYLIIGQFYGAFCGVALYAFNPSVLSFVNYIRMYSMCSMWVALFGAIVVKLYYEQENYDNFKIKGTRWRLLLCLWLVTVGGGLTHYYFYVAAFFISCFAGLYWLIKKRYGLLVKYCVTVPLGILTAVGIFPAVIEHLTNGSHASHAAENFFGGDWRGRLTAFWGFTPYGEGFTRIILFTAILLAVQLGAWLFGKKEKGGKAVFAMEAGEYIGIFGTSAVMLYLGLVSRIATFIQQRYLVPTQVVLVTSLFLIWYYAIKGILSHITPGFRSIVAMVAVLEIALAGGIPTVKVPTTIEASPDPFEEYAEVHQSEQVVLFTPDYCGFINQNFMPLRYYGDIYHTTLTPDAMKDTIIPEEFVNVTTVMVSKEYLENPQIQVWLDKFMPNVTLVLNEDFPPYPYYLYEVKR